MQPAFFIGVAGITAIFALFRLTISKVKVPYKDHLKKYIEQDRQSNFARKRDIPKELFVSPDIGRIPLREYPETDEFKYLLNKQARCERASKLTMIKPLQSVSNIDLKMEYGAANLETIIGYEDNYNRYLHSLTDLAAEMIKHKHYEDAETVLRESLAFGSDLTLSHKLLADVLLAQDKRAELESLFDEVDRDNERYAENPGLKDSVLAYIKDKTDKFDAGH